MLKIELKILGLSYSQSQTNAYALILGEIKGKRRLPIIIGQFEAQAIALELENIKPARPLTHDLLKNISDVFDIKLEEVQIYKFSEGIFYATLICNDGSSIKKIDSRTSDAVTLAMKFRCPIYTFENIMQQASVYLEETEEAESSSPSQSQSEYSSLSLVELNTALEQAILNEEYEKASLIRDEISHRKKEE